MGALHGLAAISFGLMLGGVRRKFYICEETSHSGYRCVGRSYLTIDAAVRDAGRFFHRFRDQWQDRDSYPFMGDSVDLVEKVGESYVVVGTIGHRGGLMEGKKYVAPTPVAFDLERT